MTKMKRVRVALLLTSPGLYELGKAISWSKVYPLLAYGCLIVGLVWALIEGWDWVWDRVEL